MLGFSFLLPILGPLFFVPIFCLGAAIVGKPVSFCRALKMALFRVDCFMYAPCRLPPRFPSSSLERSKNSEEEKEPDTGSC